jgi:CRP-like cAMP-binding protein
MTRRLFGDHGPTLRATPFHGGGTGVPQRLLTDRQRQELLSLSTRVRIGSRAFIYREHAQAGFIFIIGEGLVKSFRDLPSGKRRVAAFLFASDLFGLAENGRYVNNTQAVTPTLCYRIPIEPLTAVLRRDAELEYQFLCKVTHELRTSQRQAVVMGRRSATGRFAMFLKMMEERLAGRSVDGVILLPMSRSDIADYIGLSLEAVSRASAQLVRDGLIAFQGAHRVRVKDAKRLDRLALDV